MAETIPSPPTRKRVLALMVLTMGAPGILAGCTLESPEQIRQADQQRCTTQGFSPGTPQFADCLRREHYEVGQTAGPLWGPPFGSGDW